MNGLIVTGSLSKDLYEFIATKIGDSQTGEQGFYLLGEDSELKIEAEQRQVKEKAGVLAISMVIFELVKDVGVEVLAGLLVDYIREKIKSNKETHEGLAKKLIIKKVGHMKQIEMVNYSPEEIKMLKLILSNNDSD